MFVGCEGLGVVDVRQVIGRTKSSTSEAHGTVTHVLRRIITAAKNFTCTNIVIWPLLKSMGSLNIRGRLIMVTPKSTII